MALANGPWTIAIALTLLGTFAAIYHPVGIPMLVQGAKNPGFTIGVNGLAGNLGIAVAIQTLPPFTSGGVRFLLAAALMFAWLALRGRRVDVVHTASFPYLSLLAAGFLRRVYGYRLVVDWFEITTGPGCAAKNFAVRS